MTEELTIERIRELRAGITSDDWRSHYLIKFCPGTHYELPNGLHAVTGESKCAYKDGGCEGHENQNWSRLDGPETYRESEAGTEYFYSRHAAFIAAAPKVIDFLLETLKKAERG